MVEFTCWVCGHLMSCYHGKFWRVFHIYPMKPLWDPLLMLPPLSNDQTFAFFLRTNQKQGLERDHLMVSTSWLYESLCPELPCLVISTIHRKFMDFVMHFNFATIVVADVHIFLNFSLKMKRWNENLRRNLADWPKWGEYLKRGVFL